jgi:hypothetical protein
MERGGVASPRTFGAGSARCPGLRQSTGRSPGRAGPRVRLRTSPSLSRDRSGRASAGCSRSRARVTARRRRPRVLNRRGIGRAPMWNTLWLIRRRRSEGRRPRLGCVACDGFVGILPSAQVSPAMRSTDCCRAGWSPALLGHATAPSRGSGARPIEVVVSALGVLSELVAGHPPRSGDGRLGMRR